MDGNNSDWLNETVPGEQNNNVSTDNQSVYNENSVVENKEPEEKSSIVIQENTEEKKEIPTLSGMANKVEEKELSDDEKYLLEFMGPNAEKFTYKIFSFPGLILTSLYMFYRKVYLVGFITLLIQFALMFFINPFVGLIINVIVGIFFNSFYVSHCNRKIEKIKNKTGSKDFNNVVNLCGEKGGVNKAMPLLGFIMIIGLIFGCSYFFFPEQKNSKTITDFIDNNVYNISEFIEDM